MRFYNRQHQYYCGIDLHVKTMDVCILDATGRVLQPGQDSLLRRLGTAVEPASVDSALAWSARRWAKDAGIAVRLVATATTAIPVIDAIGIDTTRVGMLGHSLGGAAALQACRDDAVFRACVNMDGAPVGDIERDGIVKPTLVMLSQPAAASAAPGDSVERRRRAAFARMDRERDSTWKAITARGDSASAFVVKIVGTAHFSFSDAPFRFPASLQGARATMSASRSHSVIISRLVDFFDHFLRRRPLRVLRAGLTTVR